MLTRVLPGTEGGFVPVNDQGDAYKFVYPFGWQEAHRQPFS
jgi:hypothetical protein